MLTGEKKKEYQREYMRKRRSNMLDPGDLVRPVVLDPVRPIVQPDVRPNVPEPSIIEITGEVRNSPPEPSFIRFDADGNRMWE
jgi:hypothetical protein